MPIDPFTIAVVALGFVAGGLTKGVFGLGLPLIGVPIMVAVIPFQTAIAIFAVPTFTSNLQQAIGGGRLLPNLRRFWPRSEEHTFELQSH